MYQHRIGRKQRREHHDVAEEEDPEAVRDNDPFRSGTGFACTWQRRVPNLVNRNGDAHDATSSAWWRRSNWAICSTDTVTSSSSRNAKNRKVPNAPIKPRPAI